MGKRSLAAGFVVTAIWLGTGRTAMGGTEEGKKLFDAKKCISCHSLGTQKGAMAKLGGPLDGVGGKRDAAWIKAYLADPKAKIPNAKMPKQSLTEKEIEDLVQYVMTLK